MTCYRTRIGMVVLLYEIVGVDWGKIVCKSLCYKWNKNGFSVWCVASDEGWLSLDSWICKWNKFFVMKLGFYCAFISKTNLCSKKYYQTYTRSQSSQGNVLPCPWVTMCCFKSELVANDFSQILHLKFLILLWTWKNKMKRYM